MTYLPENWTPAALAKTELWLDAGDRETVLTAGNVRASAGERVTRWVDKIRRVNFDEVAGSGPTLRSDGIEGRQHLFFAGAHFLKYAAPGWLSGATGGDIWVMCRPDNDLAAVINAPFSTSDEATNSRYFMLAHVGSQKYFEYYTYDGTTQLRLSPSAVHQQRAFGRQWVLAHARSDGAAVTHELNHVAITTTALSGANTGQWLAYAPNRDNVAVGGLLRTTAVNLWFGGIQEIVATNAALTTNERERMREYFSRKYWPLGHVAVLGDSWIVHNIALAMQDEFRRTPIGGLSVVDHGVGGETMTQIGARWDANVEGRGYRFLVLEGGINDIIPGGVGTGATVYAEYARIVDEALAEGLRVVCLTVGPFGGHASWSSVRQGELDSLNASIRGKVANDPRLRLVDAYELTREPGTNLMKGDLAVGSFHVNDRGDTVLATAILAKLKELIY